jgi:hypothetical protein
MWHHRFVHSFLPPGAQCQHWHQGWLAIEADISSRSPKSITLGASLRKAFKIVEASTAVSGVPLFAAPCVAFHQGSTEHRTMTLAKTHAALHGCGGEMCGTDCEFAMHPAACHADKCWKCCCHEQLSITSTYGHSLHTCSHANLNITRHRELRTCGNAPP